MWALIILALLVALVVVFWVVGKIVGALIGLAMLLIVAGLASVVAQSFVKYKGDFTFTMVSGLIGGVLGIALAKALHAPFLIEIGGLPVLWTLVGSVIVVAVARVVMPNRYRRLGDRLFR